MDKDTVEEAVVGSYEYKGDDGKVYHVDYTADGNGFVPQGPHLNLLPEHIARSLKWNAEHPYNEEDQKKYWTETQPNDEETEAAICCEFFTSFLKIK